MKHLLAAILMIFLPALISALPSSRIPDAMLIEQGVKEYENKEYATDDEYRSAYMNGKCSSMWLWMHMDRQRKVNTIRKLIALFKEKDQVTILKPAEYYADEIDAVIADEPRAAQFGLKVTFQTIAIMALDYDEGIDKTETARNWFGEYYDTFRDYIESKAP